MAAKTEYNTIDNLNFMKVYEKNLESRLEVIQGHTFGHNRYSHMTLHGHSVSLYHSCPVSGILQLLCSEQPLFPHHTPMPPEIW